MRSTNGAEKDSVNDASLRVELAWFVMEAVRKAQPDPCASLDRLFTRFRSVTEDGPRFAPMINYEDGRRA